MDYVDGRTDQASVAKADVAGSDVAEADVALSDIADAHVVVGSPGIVEVGGGLQCGAAIAGTDIVGAVVG